jgi:metallo-beta-lactamase class B
MKNHLLRPFAFLLFTFTLLLSVSAQIRTDFDRSMNKPFEPFKVIGNIYYVGASDVASYLITTDKGHILIDSGFEETVPMIEKNVKKLGFELTDVKIILNNHAHYDHAGGLKILKEKTGAELYSVREQARSLENGDRDNFAFGDEISFSPVKVDRIIKDGEKIKLGTAELKTHLIPGHTKGCTAWTMTLREDRQKLDVIFLGSVSALDYDLIDNPKYPDIARDFTNTFARLKKLRPDVFLGSHAQFFKMSKKVELMKKDNSRNPFIDPEGYQNFIKRYEKDFLDKLAKQKKVKSEKWKVESGKWKARIIVFHF